MEDSQIVKVTVYNPKAPTIQVFSPLAEDQLSGNISITWEAYDPNPSDTLKFTVYYSNDNSSWNILVSNIYASEVIWDTAEIESGTYYILVTVFDGISSSTAYTGPIFFKSEATKSSPALGITTTLLCLGIIKILLKKKSK